VKTTNSKSAALRKSLCWVLGSFSFSVMAAGQDLRIEHVQVTSPERAGELRDATVDIHDGQIAAISIGSGSSRLGRSSRINVINGRNLYLAPGGRSQGAFSILALRRSSI
jgi:hypothetical protein